MHAPIIWDWWNKFRLLHIHYYLRKFKKMGQKSEKSGPILADTRIKIVGCIDLEDELDIEDPEENESRRIIAANRQNTRNSEIPTKED